MVSGSNAFPPAGLLSFPRTLVFARLRGWGGDRCGACMESGEGSCYAHSKAKGKSNPSRGLARMSLQAIWEKFPTYMLGKMPI